MVESKPVRVQVSLNPPKIFPLSITSEVDEADQITSHVTRQAFTAKKTLAEL